MKKLLFLTLALTLALGACTAAPTPLAVQPTAPEPVVVTVVVEPTQAPQQQQPIVVTVVVPASPAPEQPTAVPPPTEAPAATDATTSGAPVVLDDLLGKGVFKNITLSGNEFSLRCVTRELTITATAALIDIREAELFYRVRDYPKALYDSPWKSAGKMKETSDGVFSIVMTGEMVNPDVRQDPGWFDIQIVGLNKGGGVVDRTQKIEQLVVYRINCP
ncbi:MAG: hypothetical protein IT314_17670 [Anaerolineales bacterium]|nr:hypothetical protein [Anaerolineales bacterium]